MYSQGIDILDKADGYHLALAVPDDLQLQLLPAQNRLLDEHLADHAGLDTAAYDYFQLGFIVNQSAAGAAHGKCRTDDYRVMKL